MSRYVNDLVTSKSQEQVDGIVQEFFRNEGFEPTNYKGEWVWKKGNGLLVAPQFIKVLINGNTVHIEAWLKYAILPLVYVGEMGLTGFFGIALKQMLKSRVVSLENFILN